MPRVKYWEGRLELGGCVSAIDSRVGERSGLQTHITTTESVSLFVQMRN